MLSKKTIFIVSSSLIFITNLTYAAQDKFVDTRTIDNKNAFKIILESPNVYLPGSGLVGTSFSLLEGYTLESIKGSLFNYTFNTEQTSSNGKYLLSDNLIQIDFPYCSKISNLFTTQTLSTYKEKLNRKSGVSGGFKGFTGSYSKTTEDIREKLQKEKMHVSYAEAVCSQYMIKLKPNDPSFASWYIDELNQLPNKFEENTKKQYYDFFDAYGDSVITSCAVGGRLEQRSYINNSYMQFNNQNSVENEVKAKFFISIDKSSHQNNESSQEFELNSSSTGIFTFGGIWPESEENWASWIKSIQNLQNPACATWDALPIWQVLRKSSQFERISYELETAHKEYLNRRGCTNINAINFDSHALVEDGTCDLKKIENCIHIVHSAQKPDNAIKTIGPWSPSFPRVSQNLWMVSGPDGSGNCVLAYAYQLGGAGEIAQMGDVGVIETSPQRLWVERSDDLCLRHGKEYDVWLSDTNGENLSASGANNQWSMGKQVNYSYGTKVRLEVHGNNWGKGCKFASYGSISQPYLYE